MCDMRVWVIPGQVNHRWCCRCSSFAALEVGVYALGADGPPDLIGTYTGCTTCDPDLLRPFADSPPPGGVTPTEEAAVLNHPIPEPAPVPEPDEDQDPQF